MSWIIATDTLLAALVFRRRLWRQVPAFSFYLLFGPVSDFLMWNASTRGNDVHFVVNYSSDALYKLLNLWVTLEIYSRLMESSPALRQFASRVLWTALAILLVTSAIVYELSDLQGIPTILVIFNTAARSLRIVQLGLLSVVFFIARSFHLRLRHYYTYIAIGLVIIDCSELVALSLYAFSRYSLPFVHAGNMLRVISAQIASLMWIHILYVGEGTRTATASPNYAAMPIEEVDKWNETLSDIR